MQSRSLILALFIMVAAVMFSKPASATCVGLGCNCTVTAEPMSFQEYNPFSASPIYATSKIDVSCGALVLGALIGYDIHISAGDGTMTNRRMKLGTNNYLYYNIYTDSTYSAIWGNNQGGTSMISDGYLLQLLFSATRSYMAYGRIPGSQMTRAGNYTDVLTVSVVY